jgi:hypothetical protein
MLSSLVKEHQTKQAFRKEKQGLYDFVAVWAPQKIALFIASCGSEKGIVFSSVGTQICMTSCPETSCTG